MSWRGTPNASRGPPGGRGNPRCWGEPWRDCVSGSHSTQQAGSTSPECDVKKKISTAKLSEHRVRDWRALALTQVHLSSPCDPSSLVPQKKKKTSGRPARSEEPSPKSNRPSAKRICAGAPAMIWRGAPTSGSCRGTGTLTRGHPLEPGRRTSAPRCHGGAFDVVGALPRVDPAARSDGRRPAHSAPWPQTEKSPKKKRNSPARPARSEELAEHLSSLEAHAGGSRARPDHETGASLAYRRRRPRCARGGFQAGSVPQQYSIRDAQAARN